MIPRVWVAALAALAVAGCAGDGGSSRESETAHGPRETRPARSAEPVVTTQMETRSETEPVEAAQTGTTPTGTTTEDGATPAETTPAETTPAETTPAETTPSAPGEYALAATRACLRARGADVSEVESADPVLRELGDLAQRTSLQVRRGDEVVALAFGNAALLRSLIRAPDNPYRLEVRRNVLLLHRAASAPLAGLVRGCLRR